MKAGSSPRLSVTILITILAAFLATLGSILGNSSMPSFLLPYIRFAWPVLGIVFLLGVVVSVIQLRRDAMDIVNLFVEAKRLAELEGGKTLESKK